MSEHDFDESRFKTREEAEADPTVDLHENDDPRPHYERIRRLLDYRPKTDEPG